jgi:hypothetical protein
MSIPSIRRAAATASLLLSAVVPPAVARAQVLVRGVLYDDGTGMPVRGTVMLVDPATDSPVVHAVSDSLGQFELNTNSGVYQLAAVRAGYTSMVSAPIRLAAGEQMTIRVPIAQQGDPEHRITVVQHVRPASLVSERTGGNEGFAKRKALGTGLQFDQTKLAQSSATTLGEFLQNVAGVSVGDPGSTASMQMVRTAGLPSTTAQAGQGVGCRIGWFIDGRRVDQNGMDAIVDGFGAIPLSTIDAIEVFRGISEMPTEFATPDLGCGAVAIWLRHA